MAVTEARAVEQLVVGVLGGTGPQGRGLAVRLASVGQRMLLGSRDVDRAGETATTVTGRAEAAAAGAQVTCSGGSNADVAGAADLVIVAVPYPGHAELLADLAEPLAGKIVVDCVVPMGRDELGMYAIDVPEGSAAQQAAALLPDSTVVGAFHHVSAALLEDLTRPTLRAAGAGCGALPRPPGGGGGLGAGGVRAPPAPARGWPARRPGRRGRRAGRPRSARGGGAPPGSLGAANRRYKAHAGIRITD